VTKRAFLFAGQGAQKLGMASDLYATYPIVKETFDTASLMKTSSIKHALPNRLF